LYREKKNCVDKISNERRMVVALSNWFNYD